MTLIVHPEHVPVELVRQFDYHTDPDFLADPYEGFDRVRVDRVFFSTAHGGYWVLTAAEDIREAFQHPEIFSNRQFSIPGGAYTRTLRPLALDPPDHGTYRQPLAPLFSPPSVARREPQLRELCRELIDQFANDGHTDLLDSLCRPFPTTVFVTMLGLPLEQAAVFESLNHVMLHAYDDPSRRKAAANSILDMLDQVVVDQLAAGPDSAAGELFAALLRVELDGRPLTHDELLDYAFMLFMAGLDTVTAALGFALHRLSVRPDLRTALVSDPTAIPDAVEELLRAHAIVNTARVVTRDVEFAGVTMKEGDRVLLSTVLASRDPDEFERPDEIDFARPANRHLAFGAGPHRCIGSHLARLEIRVAIEELLRRIPDFSLVAGEHPVIHAGGVLGIDRLPVEWNVTPR